MANPNKHSPERQGLLDKLKRLLKREPEAPEPEDPYSYVTARRKPRPGSGSAAAVAELPDDR